jgi:DNA-binding MarR family transcriptional regulator
MQENASETQSQAEGQNGSAKKSSASALDYGPLNQRIGYALRRAQLAVFRDFFKVFETYDVRPAQYSLLTIVEANPGASQTQVAEALGIKKTNFVAIIDAFEKRGLISRVRSETDRRLYGLFLTEAGAAMVASLHHVAASHEQRIVDLLGAENYAGLFAPLQAIAEMGEVTPDEPEPED